MRFFSSVLVVTHILWLLSYGDGWKSRHVTVVLIVRAFVFFILGRRFAILPREPQRRGQGQVRDWQSSERDGVKAYSR